MRETYRQIPRKLLATAGVLFSLGLSGCSIPRAEIQTPAGGIRVGGSPLFSAEVLDFQGNELIGFETVAHQGCLYVDVINAQAPQLITNVFTKCTPIAP